MKLLKLSPFLLAMLILSATIRADQAAEAPALISGTAPKVVPGLRDERRQPLPGLTPERRSRFQPGTQPGLPDRPSRRRGFRRPTAPAVPPASGAASKPAADVCFECTQVIGYSQVGATRGGWYVAGGAFESIAGDDHWQLLWNGGAGVDRWRKPDYQGWTNALVSPCPAGSGQPDRVLLSISGPYGANEAAWAEAIEATLDVIQQKLPSARQIILQPVVGGPGGEACVFKDGARAGKVRASWQHHHIENAIQAVVLKRAESKVKIIAGISPKVRACDDYSDTLGHLTPEAAAAAGQAIAEYYTRLDAECQANGHENCGRAVRVSK